MSPATVRIAVSSLPTEGIFRQGIAASPLHVKVALPAGLSYFLCHRATSLIRVLTTPTCWIAMRRATAVFLGEAQSPTARSKSRLCLAACLLIQASGQVKADFWAYAGSEVRQLQIPAKRKQLLTGMLCLVGVDAIPACRIPQGAGKGRATTNIFCEHPVPAVEPKAAAKAEHQTQSACGLKCHCE